MWDCKVLAIVWVNINLQVTLTFVVYDWDGPLVGDDVLGVAKLSLSQVRGWQLLVPLFTRPAWGNLSKVLQYSSCWAAPQKYTYMYLQYYHFHRKYTVHGVHGIFKINLRFNCFPKDCTELVRKECELTIDGVNIKNDHPLGSIIVSAIFRPVAAVARSELDVQRVVPDIQVTPEDHHRNSVITTADDSADSAIPPSVVGRVSDVSRNMLKDSRRYIVGAIAGSRVRRIKNGACG